MTLSVSSLLWCDVVTIRYETIEESDLVILLISDSAMASNHEKVFSKLKKVPYRKRRVCGCGCGCVRPRFDLSLSE